MPTFTLVHLPGHYSKCIPLWLIDLFGLISPDRPFSNCRQVFELLIWYSDTWNKSNNGETVPGEVVFLLFGENKNSICYNRPTFVQYAYVWNAIFTIGISLIVGDRGCVCLNLANLYKFILIIKPKRNAIYLKFFDNIEKIKQFDFCFEASFYKEFNRCAITLLHYSI